MKTIQLTQGKETVVDDADFDYLNQHKWFCVYIGYAPKYPYAFRKVNGKAITMHRFLLAPEKGFVIDHVNGDGLDNRRSNLRVCTQRQNTYNRRPNRSSRSGIKGVSFSTANPSKPWVAVIGKPRRYLGSFRTKEEAGQTYAAAALEMYDQYAYAARNLDKSAA